MYKISHDFENKFDATTDEYIFMCKSLEMAEIIFIQGEEDIALKLSRQICANSHFELTYSMINDVWTGNNDFVVECRDIIFLSGNMSISREWIKIMREKIRQDKFRWIFIGKSEIPSGVGPMAIVEIRPEERCGMSRKDGIGIEMLGPNCTGLTRMCLRYKSADRT